MKDIERRPFRGPSDGMSVNEKENDGERGMVTGKVVDDSRWQNDKKLHNDRETSGPWGLRS